MALFVRACELKNKVVENWRRKRHFRLPTLFLVLSLVASGLASASQPDHSQPRPDEVAPGIHAEPSEHTTEEEHHSVWAGLLWPTVNFAILVGGLWYFLKAPLVAYLRDRHTAIRKDLVEAASVKSQAAAQLAEIDRKLQALPAEIEALRTRGAEEIVAEEARIAALATSERERLLEQTRREIEVRTRLARRELVEHAATLAVQIAGDRLQQGMTPADQQRLADHYSESLEERPV